MDSINGWFFEELEFSRVYKLDELYGNNKKTNRGIVYENIPKGGKGIYIYYDKNNDPIYIGKARDLRGRHSQHLNIGSTFTESQKESLVYYSYAIVEDVCKRNVYEMLYIGKYKPGLNGKRDTQN